MRLEAWKYLPNYLTVFGSAGLRLFRAIHANGRQRGDLFKVRVHDQDIWLRNTPSDRAIFRQIMVTRDYETTHWKPQNERLVRAYAGLLAAGKTPVIIDAGANIGLASLWFARRYPEAKIYAIEPDGNNIAILERNVAGLSNVTILQGALWDHKTQLRIGNPDEGAGAFRVVEAEGAVRAFCVPELPFLVARHNASLFIVKIDIEGGESAVFRSNTEWVSDAALIVIEPHDWLYPGEGTSQNLLRVMSRQRVDLLFRQENLFFFRV